MSVSDSFLFKRKLGLGKGTDTQIVVAAHLVLLGAAELKWHGRRVSTRTRVLCTPTLQRLFLEMYVVKLARR